MRLGLFCLLGDEQEMKSTAVSLSVSLFSSILYCATLYVVRSDQAFNLYFPTVPVVLNC